MAKRCLIVLPGGYPPGDAKSLRIQLLAAGLRCSGWEIRVLATSGKPDSSGLRSDDYGTEFLYASVERETGAKDSIAAAAQRLFSKWKFDSLLLYGPFWKVLDNVHTWGISQGLHTFADCTEWYAWRPWRALNSSFRDHLKFRENLWRFSGAIAISEYWSTYLTSRNLASVQVPALADPNVHASPIARIPKKSPSKNISLAYFGALSTRNLAVALLDVVHYARGQGVSVTLHCYGHQPLELSTPFSGKLKKLSLENRVVLHGRLSEYRDVRTAMRSADVLILLRGDDRASLGSFPTRLPEMLLSGTPVITSATPDVRRDLVDARDAYLISPGYYPELAAKALCRIAANPEEALRVGEAGRNSAVRLYDYKALGARLSRFMCASFQHER